MKKNTRRIHLFAQSTFIISALFILTTGCQKTHESPMNEQEAVAKNPQVLKDFEQVNLVADVAEFNAARIDPNLINAWGIAFSSGGIAWVTAQGGGVSVVYNQTGGEVRPPVAIPSPGGPTGGNPTGIVFSSSATDFLLSNGQPARFIFVGVDGILSAWNGAAGNTALLIQDNSATSVYTGLAIAASGGSTYLYAANFRTGEIDVWDKNFAAVMTMSFTDPSLPAGYAPFNIQAIGDKLYVMYAKVGLGAEEPGPGNGYVSIFNTDGSFVERFVSRGQLNAPWGVAKAPAGFWGEGEENPENAILVGNFGDGRINAFDADGNFLGQLRMHGVPIVIEGLWAIMFAPASATAIDPNKLFFAAGPGGEEHGLFGYIHK